MLKMAVFLWRLAVLDRQAQRIEDDLNAGRIGPSEAFDAMRPLRARANQLQAEIDAWKARSDGSER